MTGRVGINLIEIINLFNINIFGFYTNFIGINFFTNLLIIKLQESVFTPYSLYPYPVTFNFLRGVCFCLMNYPLNDMLLYLTVRTLIIYLVTNATNFCIRSLTSTSYGDPNIISCFFARRSV